MWIHLPFWLRLFLVVVYCLFVCLSVYWFVCYYCWYVRYSIRFIPIRIELVILKSYWFAYQTNNAFTSHGMKRILCRYGHRLNCFPSVDVRTMNHVWPFFSFDLNGAAQLAKINSEATDWIGDAIAKNINYKTSTKMNERIHFTRARIYNIYFCYSFYLNADIFVNVPGIFKCYCQNLWW